MDGNIESNEIYKTIEDGRQIMDDLSIDKKITEEEFENFMHRVTEVDKIVKKLASSNSEEQKQGQILADEILEGKPTSDISETEELKTKTNRTVIQKYSSTENNSDTDKMSQEAFLKSMEKDARERAENRKIRNERAETLKRIGNGAFREGNYEKAVTYYSKAVEQRKDSSVLWNNRALSYMRLGLYEKALQDCEWALKVSDSNLKALLNRAKCYLYLGNEKKCEECIRLAREKNPYLGKLINEFEEKCKKGNPKVNDTVI